MLNYHITQKVPSVIIDLFVFLEALTALLTPATFVRQMEGRKTEQSHLVLSIMMPTDLVVHTCFSSHVNHVSVSVVCVHLCAQYQRL